MTLHIRDFVLGLVSNADETAIAGEQQAFTFF